jgi:hypothetical protein
MRKNNIDLQTDELSRDLGVTLAAPLCPTILNRDIATLKPSALTNLHRRRDQTRLNSRRFNRLDSYAPKTKRVPTAERITLLGSSARTKS